MREKFLVFGKPKIDEAAIAEVTDSLRSGWIGTGPKVFRFEEMLQRYVGAAHVRCLASCTAALFLTMRNLGFGPGDEVLVPAMTFVASANAVEHTGATPVFVDSEPDTGLIDLDAAAAKIGPNTRAIMPVHLAGRPVHMERLNELRDRHDLQIVEDAAHALGAKWRGRQIGTFGNPTAYSFYATKNITTIEGGALATNNERFAERIEQSALHGLSVGAWQRYSDDGFKHYEATELGYKFNMTDVQAALGLHQLPKLDSWIEERAEQWRRYDDELKDLPLVTPPPPTEDMRHARHLYRVSVGPSSTLQRDELLSSLHRRNIGAGVHYRGVHLHPYYREKYAIDPRTLPVATADSESTISLPLGPAVTSGDQDDVVQALEEIFSNS